MPFSWFICNCHQSAFSINRYLEKWSLIESETARHVHSMHTLHGQSCCNTTHKSLGREDKRMCGTCKYGYLLLTLAHTHTPPKTHLSRVTLIIDCFFLSFYYCLLLLTYLSEQPENKDKDSLLLVIY